MRAVLPEVVIAVLVLGIAGLVLLGVGLTQWVAGMAVAQRIKDGRRRRVVEREQAARRAAQWEVNTDYQRGYAIVRLVKVARWAGNTKVIDTDEHHVILPEEDLPGITRAQIDAALRAEQRNIK